MEPSGFSLPRAECFPAGLRVLVVDDDLTWLKILERMLKKCNYEVTTCGLARVALDLLRGRKDGYDIVISDVNMPDMDGFKLLEQVGLEMDIPVIMMSVDGETSRVMKGVQHGACDYLLKPIRMKELRNIWQHVFRKRMHEVRDIEGQECFDMTTSVTGRKRKDVDGNHHDPAKKARVVWTVELHQKFVKAVNRIGFDKAGPKKILDLMNVKWLTRENVASHLQKYRLYLTRLQKGNGSKATFGATNDAPISAFYQNPVTQKATAMPPPPHHILANETKIKEISFDYQSFDPLNSTVKSESTASAQLSWTTKGQAQPFQSKQHGPFHNPGSSWNFDKPTQAYCRNKVDGSSWDFEKLTQHGRNKMNEVALKNEWQHKMHGLATEDGNAPALFTVQPQSHPNGFHHVIDFIPFSSWDPKNHGLQKDPFGDQKNTGFDWDEKLGDYLTNEELPDDFFGNVELFGFANHKMIADFVPPLHDPLKFDSDYSDHMEYPVIYQGLFIA